MSSISNYPVLVIEYPDNRSETWWLNHDEVTLGRSRECSIVIHSDLVSRKHIRIQKKDNYCFVEDLKSTNGTRING
jgi:adenylate cyclase